MPAAHDIYNEQLSQLRRGQTLYYPEPHPDQGPIKIGDVGYTKHGAFHRFFNVSFTADHPSQRFGVPNGFEQLDMGLIHTFEGALEPGPLHSKTVYTAAADIGAPGAMLPAQASFRFNCSPKRGAIILLETEATHEKAAQSHHLETYLERHCSSWHDFARKLDIPIGFGDIMLVTETSKAGAWSSMVYSNSSTEFSLAFSGGAPFATTGAQAGVAASASIERIGPIERRRSRQRPSPNDAPPPHDHTVFVKAYRMGTRRAYLYSLPQLFMKTLDHLRPQGHADTPARASIPEVRDPSTQDGPSSSSLMHDDDYPMESLEYDDSPAGQLNSDFHPTIALLARVLEARRDQSISDSNCVVVHDDAWCSATVDSEEARLIKQYADFYFNLPADLMSVQDPSFDSSPVSTPNSDDNVPLD